MLESLKRSTTFLLIEIQVFIERSVCNLVHPNSHKDFKNPLSKEQSFCLKRSNKPKIACLTYSYLAISCSQKTYKYDILQYVQKQGLLHKSESC